MAGQTKALGRRLSLASVMATLAIAVPSGASAQVTIGQLAPPVPPASCAGVSVDITQGTLTSGTPYVVPSTNGVTDWTVISWSHSASAGPGQTLTMKIFRPLGGNTYMVVGHDGPHSLLAGTLNTFPTSVPGVKPGDVLGLHADPAANACNFFAPNPNSILSRSGDLADGQSGAFGPPNTEKRVNISAVITPSPNAQCQGKAATTVGTAEGDALVGTPGPDVVAALGGKDKVSGLAGKDLICGGKGKDKLNGGKGKDKLLGQAAADTLRGGGGNDTCKGGKGRDVENSC